MQNILPEKYKGLDQQEVFDRIRAAKEKLGDDVFILAHHYQRDTVFQFADATGDSLKLSMLARDNTKAKYIVFCGVHFMAETADILNDGQRVVTLPDATAGCPMADSAKDKDVRRVWSEITDVMVDQTICPITYINCYASLKAFCGEHGGTICTSTNAMDVLTWGLEKYDKVFFFPDQHLGRNIAKLYGVPRDRILQIYHRRPNLGVSHEELRRAKVILWDGMCPVHDRFMIKDIEEAREKDPEINVLVHPEVPEEVAAASDYMGSTEFIIKKIKEAPKGSKWLIATEVHLVGRLAKQHPDKDIKLLGKPICMCSMMDRTSPEHLLWNLESILEGDAANRVSVEKSIIKNSKLALKRMFEITKLKDEPKIYIGKSSSKISSN